MSKEKKSQAVQTTGHAWDGDIQEFNNPLPTWWVWGFYLTVVFAIVYWFLYPAWPVGDSYTKGMGNTIEYTTKEGKKVVSHWTTRALYQKELQIAREKQAVQLEKYSKLTFEDINKDDAVRAYAISVAKVLFADNCAACHQPGGAGLLTMYPSLVDDDWIWGSQYKEIETSIRAGRKGTMPSFSKMLNDKQISDVSSYVLSLSSTQKDGARVNPGKEIFNSNCAACHTQQGTGNILLGSANLADKIWTVADITLKMNDTEKTNAIKNVVRVGISREMPSWEKRFTDLEIKMLTFYVHELGSKQ
ncbi:Cytochrome c oxidase (cbb3-type) subunit CcoP [hydrothermal vent metagenome]|uniref:Cytochrome c oxidase subunit III n=1 Tax=hydrothermal vent metagenome TaxID=652676 RepID=A0A3B1A6X0_9ZZZZ